MSAGLNDFGVEVDSTESASQPVRRLANLGIISAVCSNAGHSKPFKQIILKSLSILSQVSIEIRHFFPLVIYSVKTQNRIFLPSIA